MVGRFNTMRTLSKGLTNLRLKHPQLGNHKSYRLIKQGENAVSQAKRLLTLLGFSRWQQFPKTATHPPLPV